MAVYQAYKSSLLSADITKLVKGNYDPQPVPPYKFKRVSNRTQKNLIEERPKDLWQRHYARRRENLNRGFQSVPWETYKPIGGQVVLDPYALVFSSMQDNLSPKIWKQPRAFKFQYEEKKEKRKMSILPPLLTKIRDEDIPQDSISVSSLREDICPTAGFQKIKDYMSKSKQVIKNVRAGQSYEEYIRTLQENEKQYVDEKVSENEMVLMSLSDLGVDVAPQVKRDIQDSSSAVEEDENVGEEINQSTPIFVIDTDEQVPSTSPEKSKQNSEQLSLCLPGLLPVASFIGQARRKHSSAISDDDEKLSSDPSSDVSPLLYVKSATSRISNKKRRIRRDHLQFLEALHIVLSSIHNMRTRDLKSKVPLTSDHLKLLQKEYIPITFPGDNTEGKHSNVSRYQSRLNRMSATTVDSDAPPVFHPNLLSRRGTISANDPSLAVISALGAQKFGASRRKSKMPVDNKSIKPSSQVQLDTWEDLLLVEDHKLSGLLEKSYFSGPANVILKALAWQRRAAAFSSTPPPGERSPCLETTKDTPTQASVPQAQPSSTENRQQKKLPIWQLIAMEKPTSVYKDKTKRRHSPDPDRVVERHRSKFNKLKCKVEHDTEAELTKIDREKMATFKCKYAAFKDMSPLYEEHRLRLKMKTKNKKLNLNPQDIQPSLWYEKLCDKTYSITGPDDEEVNDVLQKISKFSLMDGKSLMFGKAKVCLYVMSVPLTEMWTFSYQKAVQYVLVTIMGYDVNDFIDWLELRKLTFILDKE